MTGHAPVMVAEALRWLEPARGGVFVDCTLGLGGHSQALLEGGASRVIAIDRDAEAIAMARERLDAYGDRVDIAHADYRDLGAVLDARGLGAVDGVLADLGLSERPMRYVMNKMDAIPGEQATAVRDRIANLSPDSLLVSALAAGGLDPLRDALRDAIRRRRPVLEIRIPASNGRLLAEVHREGEVLEQRADEDVMVVRARLDERAIGRLRHAGARITVTAAA